MEVTGKHINSIDFLVDYLKERSTKYPEICSFDIFSLWEKWIQTRTTEQMENGEGAFDFFIDVYDEFLHTNPSERKGAINEQQ